MAANVTLDMLNNYNGIRTVFSQQSQSIANNTTVIRATVTQYSTAWSSWGSASTVTIKVDGQSKNLNVPSWNWSGANSRSLGYLDFTVTNNAEGKKSAAISQYWNHEWGGTKTGTFVTDTIPRASTIGTISGNQIGSTITVNISRKSSSFTHQVWYRLPGQGWQNLGTGYGTSCQFTIPLSQSSFIANATSGNCEISIQTKSGSTNIGNEVRKNHTVQVPSSVVPTFTSLTHKEYVSAVSTNIGAYVQGNSRVTFTINGANGIYGSSIKTYRITFDGQALSAASGTTQVIKGSGNLTATAVITDSRGRTATRSVTLSVLAYSIPTFARNGVLRTNSDGSANQLGTYATVDAKITAKSLMVGGVEKNKITYTINSRRRGTSTWESKRVTNSEITYDGKITLSGYSIDYGYDFQLLAKDELNTTILMMSLSSGIVSLHVMDDTVSVGKIVNQTTHNLYVAERGAKFDGPIIDKNNQEVLASVDYVIDSDTNSNGTWEKWASGKLVQWGTFSDNTPCDGAWGVLFDGRIPAHPYPIPFATIPTFSDISIIDSPRVYMISQSRVPRVGDIGVAYIVNPISRTPVSITYGFYAVGMWK